MSFARSAAAPVRSALRNAAIQQRSFSTAKAGNVNVAAADDGALTSTITVAIKAGPRYESIPGVAHVLKNFLFKSNDKRSALRLVREAEFYGGVLSTALTKEHLLLTAEFLRGDEEFFVEILGDVLTKSKFAAHEFHEEVLPQVLAEHAQAQASPKVLGFDALLQTAYRQRGLGASLFASPATPVSHQRTVAYAKSVFAKDNIAVLGSGIEAGKLSSLVSKHFGGLAESASISSPASKYFGGEQRIAFSALHGAEETQAAHGHFLIGFEGAGHQDGAASASLAVLRSLLGGESSIKWSKGTSALSQVADKVVGSEVNSFNLSFSDSGVFGVHVSAPHSRILEATKAVGRAFKQVADGVSAEELSKAIAKSKYETAAALETSRIASHEAVAGQLLAGGSKGDVTKLEEKLSQLESVSKDGLAKAAEKLVGKNAKATTVAVGNVYVLPYADEIL